MKEFNVNDIVYVVKNSKIYKTFIMSKLINIKGSGIAFQKQPIIECTYLVAGNSVYVDANKIFTSREELVKEYFNDDVNLVD